ncbi:MAG: hypothetical protein CFH34_00308 [Alphaproteobacteria bacterium MarineAlpha9_Bin4]|nr:hypothetical protein [Pelagibacterales bacterium]PPR27367.1 MAG: hypothetical protein CFH34_00308 [Alphaproteobacteria bacterium MarineAlpha9_Bin4]
MRILNLILLLLFIKSLHGQEDLGEVEVIGISPLPGIFIEKNKYPNTSQSISETKIKNNLSKTFVDIMNENLSGLTVKDVQNGNFQKNVDYRGFTASPLLGESQGITVYLDGIRVNESFGDTVQWELIPEYAVKKVDLMSSNPAFGLNALGGSLALTTKKGLDYKNEGSYFDSTVKIGSFLYHSEVFEFGTGTSDTGLYSSIEKASDGGWRDHSEGKIERIYTNLGHEKENYLINFSILGADTDLNGNGVTPIELLQVDRASVFTWPDNTTNKVLMMTGSGSFFTENNSIISANLYVRRLFRNTFNADEVDAEECAENSAADASELQSDYGFDDSPLCGEDNSTGDYGVILDQNGNAIESDDNIRKYGLLNKTFTTTTTIGGAVQYDTFYDIYNKEHQFSMGLSYDQAKSYYRSGGFLGILTNERTVTPLNNSFDQPIELVAEQEHSGNGSDPDEKERGDVGPAEVTGKLNLFGAYVGDTFKLNEKTTFSSSVRANIAFVELVDNFKTDIYTRTAFVNGDHRYFRVNPALGLVRDLSNSSSLLLNYREASRTPSPVELSCADPGAPCRLPNAFVADPPLEQVITRALEAGIRGFTTYKKFSLDWSSIGYLTRNYEDIIFVSSGTGLSSGYFKNFGETQRLGLDLTLKGSKKNKNNGLKDFFLNYSFMRATFQSAHTLPAANHPNSVNDVETGDIIPGMPEHKLNASITYKLLDDLNVSTGLVAASGVFLRGDESNQLNKTSPYAVFNLTTEYTPKNNFRIFARVDNLLNSNYETMGVLGEASSDEVNVPIAEIGDTGIGDTAVGALDPNFLSPGQPRSFFLGFNLEW